jgi:hypothetical protein
MSAAAAFSTAELISATGQHDDMQEDASATGTYWGSPINTIVDAKKSTAAAAPMTALEKALAEAYKEAVTEDSSEEEEEEEEDDEDDEEEVPAVVEPKTANGVAATPPQKDKKFLDYYKKAEEWADEKLENPAAFKQLIAKATNFEDLKEIREDAAKARKNANDKKRRADKRAAAAAKAGKVKTPKKKKQVEESESGSDDDAVVDVPLEDDDEEEEPAAKKRATAVADYDEELTTLLAKQIPAAAAPPVTLESPTRKRSLARTTESETAAKFANQPPPPPRAAVPPPPPPPMVAAAAPKETVTTVAPPPPPLDILRFMFGSRFLSSVAQLLIDKGAKSVLGTLPQASFMASVADSTIALARPDLADEANRVTSKSSSSSDKDAVRTLREVIQQPKALEAKLIVSRMNDLRVERVLTRSPIVQLLGFAAMTAANAVLNASFVANGERTLLAIAMATSDNHKHEFRLSMSVLSDIGVFYHKPLIDLELAEPWRLKANRYTLVRLCENAQPVLIHSELAKNPTATPVPSAKRTRFDDTLNTTFEVPSAAASAAAAAAAAFTMPMTMAGPHGMMHYSSEDAFKYDARALLKNSNSGITLLPNKTMMALFSMMFESLNTPDDISTLFAVLHKNHMRARNVQEKKLDYRPANPFSAPFVAISDTSVPERSGKFYADHTDVERTGHEYIVQLATVLMKDYATSAIDNENLVPLLKWDLVIAHVLFSFIRMDPALADERIGEIAQHQAARVLSSDTDRTGVPVTLSAGELPVGVGVRVPDLIKRVLQRMWMRFLNHLGLLDKKLKLVAGAAEHFLDAYEKAHYGDLHWVVTYFKPASAGTHTPDQRKQFREALVPMMFALFPPSFMGSVQQQ